MDDDDQFTAMLRRATEEPPPDLLHRMQTLAETERDASRIDVARRRAFPRAWTVALVAASAVVLVVGLAFGLRDTPDPSPATGGTLDGNYLPSSWPSGLDGPVETTDLNAQAQGNFTTTLLTMDGVVAVSAMVMEGERPSSTDDGIGQAGIVSAWADEGDRSIYLVAPSSVGQATLDALATTVEPDGRSIAPWSLPDGWTIVEDPSGVAHAAFLGRPNVPASIAQVSSQGIDAAGQQSFASVFTIRTDEAAAEVDRVRALAGSAAQEARIGDGFEPLLVEGLSPGWYSIVWSPEPGVVVVAAGTPLSRPQLMSIVSSARPVSAAEWDELRVPELVELSDEVCVALQANPEGLGSVMNRTGITRYGGSWAEVLSPTLFELDDDSVARVADAVADDREGFEAFRGSLHDSQAQAFDRLREIASDPDRVMRQRDEPDPAIARDALLVRRVGSIGCGFG